MKYIIYKLIRTLGLPIYKILYPTKVIGIENIPSTGGAILAGNHTHNLNAATMVGIPKRVVHILAKKELFETKLGNSFFHSMGCIKVDRKIHDENVKSEAEKVLLDGNLLGIFPEGTTNKTKEIILPFKYGAVSFAKNTGCPIVPFAITGKYRKFRKGLTIEFGKPIYIKRELEKENNRLMIIVKTMIMKGNINEKN